ncbi:DUF6234 family protein [Streptomyces incarnatus]
MERSTGPLAFWRLWTSPSRRSSDCGSCPGSTPTRAAVAVGPQAVMAALVCVSVFGGAAARSHRDRLCRDPPSATGCKGGGDWTAAARVTAARADSGPSRARRTMPRPDPRSSAGNRWRRP